MNNAREINFNGAARWPTLIFIILLAGSRRVRFIYISILSRLEIYHFVPLSFVMRQLICI